uniref:Uncharacterized protein n=1 Tax=Glossina pallidipes TaxID=7398 RepID=A0A1A9Z2S8_GLOPL
MSRFDDYGDRTTSFVCIERLKIARTVKLLLTIKLLVVHSVINSPFDDSISYVLSGGDKMCEHVNTRRKPLYGNLGLKINAMLTNNKLLGPLPLIARVVARLDRVKVFNFKVIYLDFVRIFVWSKNTKVLKDRSRIEI